MKKFTVETEEGIKYDVEKKEVGNWNVVIQRTDTRGNITGVLSLPKEWAATRVFQFIESINPMC